jgi:hypothetical protein
MNKKTLYFLIFFNLLSICYAQENVKSIQGSWKVLTVKFDGKPQDSKNKIKIKILSKNYFTWFSCDKNNRITRNSVGGTYTFDGKKYVENIQYVGVGATGVLKKVHTFDVQLKGDKMYLTGRINKNKLLEETWQRIDSID